MGHVGHKGTLAQTRLVGAFCLFLQALLLLDEVGHVTHHAIGAHHLTVLVEEGYTLNEVPLQVFALMEEGAHVGQVCTLHTEIGLILSQSLFERTVHKVINQFVEVQTQLWHTHTFIEGTDTVLDIDPEEAHVTVLHQVLQFILIALDSLVLLTDTCLVVLVFEIELALLRDVSDREGDEEEFALFVFDGVEA